MRRKLKFLLQRAKVEDELDDELRAHLELQARKHVANGIGEAEARRLARLEFGCLANTREECREADRCNVIDSIFRNVRYAFRSLRKSPGFAAIAVCILGIGIGANLAIFNLLNALFVRPLPLKAAAELVQIARVQRDGGLGELPSTFLEALKNVPDYQGLCGFETGYPGVEVNNSITSTGTLGLSGDCFGTLGIRVQLGRDLTPADDNRGAEAVALITDAFWRRQFNARPSALGERIRVEGQTYTIVGVAEPRFKGLLAGFPAGIITMLSPEHSSPLPDGRRRTYWWVNILARRAPGVSQQEALARLKVRGRQLLEASVPPNYSPARRKDYLDSKITLTSGAGGVDYFLRRRFGGYLYAAQGICAAILLIGCVNLASLLLARSLKRRREVTVRLALGAKRSHVAWLFATESLLLILAGGLAGFPMAQVLDRWLMTVGDREFGNFNLSLAFDWRIAVFLVMALVVIAGVLSAASAWQVDRLAESGALKEGGRGVVGSNSTSQNVLIALQIALTLALVAVSGLSSASLKKYYGLDLGVDSRKVWDVMLSTRPGVQGHFETGPYYRELLRRVKSMPEVKSAALADWVPFFVTGGDETISALDIGKAHTEIQARVVTNSADFARTLGMKMVAGDGFGSDDHQGGEPAVVISESLAERLGNDLQGLIGHHVRIGLHAGYERLRIAGVVSNAQTDLSNARERAPLMAYSNIWQHPEEQQYPVLLIKTRGNDLDIDSVRRIVSAGGREYVDRVRTLGDEKDGALMEDRMLATLSGAFSALALMMAGIGLFGLLSYQIGNRTGEIGIRMALGAERKQIRWLVLRQIVTVIAIGGSLGLILSLGVGKGIAGILFEVSPYSPSLLAISYLVLTATALLASWLPIRRATSIDPVVALRHE